MFQFLAVAQEDMGLIGDVNFYKAPMVSFKTLPDPNVHSREDVFPKGEDIPSGGFSDTGATIAFYSDAGHNFALNFSLFLTNNNLDSFELGLVYSKKNQFYVTRLYVQETTICVAILQGREYFITFVELADLAETQ